jgi:two-component system, chemotaxis family, CheB/CheR fusion protein
LAHDHFLVVGIGASAGGVEALQAFFEPMPSDPGMAFIVVTHLGAGHESALPQILGRSSELPVVPARNGAAIEPNRVYVLSSDAVPTLRRGKLRLRAQAKGGREYNPIDIFLASLAEDRGENAVGVILSGTGHDGTLGAKAIKEKGGLTMAQLADHTAPRYPDMPANAIASGAIDLKLPVQDMAGKLIEYARSLGTLDSEAARERGGLDAARRKICEILQQEIGHNFAGYKERTFLRRVERRMQVLDLRELGEYIERLRQDRQEVVQLFHDLLIGVTAFFRDTEAFDGLAEQVIPQLFEGKGPGDTVRIWVPGCATGEEAYSIAILMLEHMARTRIRPKVVIFATDIDDPAIAVARAARYPAAMLHDVGAERLDRYFIGDGVSYTLAKEVRDLCIFSSHSVIRDPPFSRIDLISCRNLLIYMDKELQQQLIPVFHYALRPGGYLFLGTSETLTQHPELFHPVDKKHRIFRRRDHVAAHPGLPLVLGSPRTDLAEPKVQVRNHTGLPLRHVVESRVIEQFAPAHVVVTRDGDVVHFSTRTGKYLENAPGAPSRNVVAMARRGLRLDLRAALGEAVERRRLVSRPGLRLELDGRVQFLDLTVEPLPDHDIEPLFLIVFTDVGAPLSPEKLMPAAADQTASAELLETELRDTRERLQSTVEEYETALEELKSANEELVSINEELQSTIEELETSREEAQSVNEELHTVNSELQRKIEELDRASDNMRNLFDGTDIATVFVDRDLVIRSFTPAIKRIFNLMEIDRGRPLTDIVSIVDFDPRQEIEPVLASGQSRERRVTRRDGTAHYLMRVLPYRTADKSGDGVVITFTDVTRITEIEQYQEELSRGLERLLEIVRVIAERSLDAGSGRETLLNRLQALADTYRLVVRAKWRNTPLPDLAAKELAHYGIGREGRVAVEGPPVQLKPRAAIAIGMALHELTANAARYGALSVPQGRVHLSWAIEGEDGADRRLVIRWRESDGPKLSQPENTRYGRTLIENGLAEQIGASGSIAFAEDGLRSELSLPLGSGLVLPSDADAD